ncbi:MAG: hypothetical protein D6725_14525 [Planctomycetota bacterium]|nr:MAG: hypothetical protein D6725_14525 [Planctomycetota bacterium]
MAPERLTDDTVPTRKETATGSSPPDSARRPLHRTVTLALAAAALLAGTAVGTRGWAKWKASQLDRQWRSALDERDWQRAAAVARRLAVFRTADGDFWLDLADCARELDDAELAAIALGHVPEDDPRHLNALLLQADLLFGELDRPLEAAAVWKRMLQLDPLNATAFQRLIYFYAMTVQRAELVETIRLAMERHREPPEAYTYLVLSDRLQFSDALFRIRRWRKQTPGSEILEVADAYFASQQRRPAANGTEIPEVREGSVHPAMQQCLRKYPKNLEVLAYHAEQARLRGDHDALRRILLEAPPEAERDARFWRFRGWLLRLADRLPDAEAAYRQALNRNAYDWRARLELAAILRLSGKTGEAAEQSRIALLGKTLERRLLELPNAAALDGPIVARLYEYARQLGDRQVVRALEYRGVRL